MSGHSKWSQIKHKKALTDAKKGILFSKLSKEITVAVKTGGANPDMNTRLRTAMERARSEGMPKDNIDRAIQKVAGNDSDVTLQEFVYEALGPGGCNIIIEGITDNKNRTFNEIKLILSNNGSKIADQGSLLWNFDKIGSIQIDINDNQEKNKDDLINIIIESGASDLQNIDNFFIVETIFTDLDKIRKTIEQYGIKIKNSGHDYKAKTLLELDEQTKNTAEKVLEEIAEQSDVQEVYTNIK